MYVAPDIVAYSPALPFDGLIYTIKHITSNICFYEYMNFNFSLYLNNVFVPYDNHIINSFLLSDAYKCREFALIQFRNYTNLPSNNLRHVCVMML